MPFKSERQRRFMHAKHPDIAQRWEEEAKAQGKKRPVKKAAATKKRRKK